MNFNSNDTDNESGGFEKELPSIEKKKPDGKNRVARAALIAATVVLFAAAALYGALLMIFDGPSDSAKAAFTAYAQSSDNAFIKGIPSFFASEDEAYGDIESDADPVFFEESMPVLPEKKKAQIFPLGETEHDSIKSETGREFTDGVRLDKVKKERFTASVLLVKDPSRVFVAVSSDFSSDAAGLYIDDLCERDGLTAAVNGGADKSGGAKPGGLVISEGKVLAGGDASYDTVVGFTSDGVLEVVGMTQGEIANGRFRDALNVGQALISNGEVVYKPNGEVVTSADLPNPRTAIGQLADGTVMLVCVDGRMATSLGASLEELCGLFSEYGAVTAANLSGGASSAMVYEGELVSTPSSLYGTKRLPTFIGVKGVTADEE